MTLQRPMFPPSRRGFLAMTAGAAVVPVTVAIAAPASPLAGPYSPALAAASLALQGAHDAAQAARAVYNEACDKAEEWERQNPSPTSRRGIKRWLRKASAFSNKVTHPAFVDLLVAEKVFTDAQIAFAKIPPRDERDLNMMACRHL
jgi:hypothetical protein